MKNWCLGLVQGLGPLQYIYIRRLKHWWIHDQNDTNHFLCVHVVEMVRKWTNHIETLAMILRSYKTNFGVSNLWDLW
jgi:hypothetical protein